ncbi:MAG TPA: right-handed parallel beta-helix repeat-containing protein, partial [Polyangiaceae bacterium]
HQPPLEFANGTDDGIVMTDEPGLSIHDNTMTNFFDCGIEWVGVIRSATIRNNHISKAGVSGIGGWYWSGLVNSTISGNTVDQSGDLFLHNRIGGLRPAGFDSQHLMPADEAVVFHDNVFDGNSLTNPSDYSLLSTNAAADIPFYDYLLDLGGIGGIPGERATTQADFQLTNNVFQNNQFGHVRLAPSFGSGTPIAGVVVDGGNNTCTSPTPAGYPLHCN